MFKKGNKIAAKRHAKGEVFGFQKGNKIGHRFTKKNAKELGKKGAKRSAKIKKFYTKKERQNRSERMKNLNLFYKTKRKCIHCKKTFLARLRQHYCKKCTITNKLKKRYNITEEEYNEMLKKHSNLCELCLKRPAKVIDHDHETGKVRGILCKYCNTSLRFFDNKELFKKMYTYSNKFRENET